MAQGVAWAARERGVTATIVVPEHAPATKLAAVERLGGKIVRVSHEEWWQTMLDGRVDGRGLFVHPVQNDRVMAGNGTIGLELVEQLDGIDAVVVPWGGGGLFTGIASALAARSPADTGLRAGRTPPQRLSPQSRPGIPSRPSTSHSFVDGAARALSFRGCGSAPARRCLRRLTDEAAAAVRLLAERAQVVAEGAGALASPRRWQGVPAPVASSASSPAGTSTRQCSRRSSRETSETCMCVTNVATLLSLLARRHDVTEKIPSEYPKTADERAASMHNMPAWGRPTGRTPTNTVPPVRSWDEVLKCHSPPSGS